MFPLLQAAPPVDLDLVFKVGGILAAIAAAWGVMKAQSQQTAETLKQVVAGVAQSIETGKAAADTAAEALRQAVASHGRIDRTDTEVRRLREQFLDSKARQEERARVLVELRSTGALKPPELFKDGWTGDPE